MSTELVEAENPVVQSHNSQCILNTKMTSKTLTVLIKCKALGKIRISTKGREDSESGE